ncbi:hypothetical protein ACFE04_005663 [Oxalis oulophora]
MEYLKRFYIVLVCLSFAVRISEAYDPFDPNGNISIRWDIISWTPDDYVATITMNNFQIYRQIRNPGWTLGWTWRGKEVIWSVVGAQATDQGRCSKFKGNIPHCCSKSPNIVDLLPGVPYNKQYSNCCKAGLLASQGQDQAAAVSAFQVSVGQSGTSNMSVKVPRNFYLLGPGPGYTCSSAKIGSPTVSYSSDGRRKSYAMMSWTVVCTYSQLLASKNPTCCLSLSSFYNPRITPCQNDSRLSTVLKSNTEAELHCTEHMCPIRVHWHVKANYKEYWRVKISITNFVNHMNYTQWTLVVRHPNLNNVTKAYSFGYKPISQFKPLNDTGMFYGIKYYNDMLTEAGQDGYVHTEIMFRKDMEIFTLENGWAFPLKVYFNGDECIMPDPDLYPYLPSSANARHITLIVFALVLLSAF